MKYDVIIVGSGPCGIFSAYELVLQNKGLNVLLVDKGSDIYKRKCPILENKIARCPIDKNDVSGCKPACSITNGFGGAGAYSDGKFNITSEFGGWMSDYLSNEEVTKLIKYVDEINLLYGATTNLTDPTTLKVKEIEKKASKVGLKLLRANVRHLGTENNLKILTKIYEYLNHKVTMKFATEVKDIHVVNNQVKGIYINDTLVESDYVVLSVGRDGNKWLEKVCKNHNIKMTNNHVDIGVRVETSNEVMKEINEHLYEGKFVYKTKLDTEVRTFCSNPSGHVVVENHSGTMLANGHAYADETLGTENTNFALLVSHKLEDAFTDSNKYADAVSKLANQLSCGSLIVQKYGDIKSLTKTTKASLKSGCIKPSLDKAIPGDLGLVLPYNTMMSLIEMIEALEHITPGIAGDDTLFYGVESKFYSARPLLDNNFETQIKGLYAGGDGAGLTRGLAQAGACGVYIARNILKNKAL